MQTTLDEIREKVKRLKHLHHMQLNQVDLSLETAPRDSRYSNNLLEMMKKEEVMLSRDPSAPTTRSLIAKVDEGLRQETQAFFNRLSTQNLKKWEKMHEKMKNDRQQLKQEILTKHQHLRETGRKDNGQGASPSVQFNTSGESHVNKTYTMDDIEREEEKLNADYYKNWHRYETYHLNQAFRSQMSRIDADWDTHEKEIHQDYASKKSALTGVKVTINSDNSNQSPDANRWQHPEKQKTLIHTAPVFSPQRPASGTKSATGKKSLAQAAEVSIFLFCKYFLICDFSILV
jgi:hypothetical protein